MTPANKFEQDALASDAAHIPSRFSSDAGSGTWSDSRRRSSRRKPGSGTAPASLGRYLAITAGAGAIPFSATDAAVVSYTGPSYTVTNDGSELFLWWSPASMTAGVRDSASADIFQVRYKSSDYLYTQNADSRVTTEWGTQSTVLLALDGGTAIDANSNTWYSGTWAYLNKSGWTTQQSPWATGVDGTTGFVPFRFANKSSPSDWYYGWANLTYNNGPSESLTLNSFAYESTPNAAITTEVVPEPTTLALLAIGGASGVALARRRVKARRQQQATH